jgi:GT2 family glycosyltransferase
VIPISADSPPEFIAVIPYYKGTASHLNAAIKSLLQQTSVPTKIIVMDDYSPYPAWKLISDFGTTVEVVRNERNLGFSGNMNRALSMVSNEEFIFMLQDDVVLLDPHYLSQCLAVLKDPTVGVVSGQAVINQSICDYRMVAFARYWDIDYKDHGISKVAYSFLKADMFRVSALDSIGGFLFVENPALGLEDQVIANNIAQKGFTIIRNSNITYSVQDVRSNTFSSFLKKECTYGSTLGYAIASNAIATNFPDAASSAKRNHRIRQVILSFSAFLLLTLSVLLLGSSTGLLSNVLLLCIISLELGIYLFHGRDIPSASRLYLAGIGIIADFLFALSFGKGALHRSLDSFSKQKEINP